MQLARPLPLIAVAIVALNDHVYLRALHLSGLGTQVGAGIVLKGHYALVWSR